MIRYIILVISVCLLLSTALRAEVPISYKQVAEINSVPDYLLYSIALTESGTTRFGRFSPWPWTLNICGAGIYLDSKEEAEMFLKEAIDVGCSVDVGLFQIHWQSHYKLFDSPSQALDPIFNMQVGAYILSQQYVRTKDWYIATGGYHSPSNKVLAHRYREKVYSNLGKFIK